MLVDERAASFVRSLIPDEEQTLYDIGLEAKADFVPIIRPETRAFLNMLFHMKRPLQVLEIGTAVGYSAIFMSTLLPEQGHITTIENYEPRYQKACRNIEKAKAEDKITLCFGDAQRILPTLEQSYDLIFMDAAKGQYLSFFHEALRLLNEDGVIVSDNVLQDGEILESHFTVPKRNRTIHDRMREYLQTITKTKGTSTTILTVGDGIAVTVRTGGDKE